MGTLTQTRRVVPSFFHANFWTWTAPGGNGHSRSLCSVCAPLRTEPKHRMKTGYSQSPERGAGNAMFFVSHLQSSSQAGRRRFESGLPLHVFNDLGRLSNFLHSNSLR